MASNPSGIPNYATPFLNSLGLIEEVWYRYLRTIGTFAVGAVALIQDTLANRPAAANYHDGTVLFIDIDTSLMYYVHSAAWVQLMNFIGWDGTTVTAEGNLKSTGNLDSEGLFTAHDGATVDGAAIVTGALSSASLATGDITAHDIAANSLTATAAVSGATLHASGAITGDSATITHNVGADTFTAATGVAGAAITGASLNVSGAVTSASVAGGAMTGSSLNVSGAVSAASVAAAAVAGGVITGTSVNVSTFVAAGTTLSSGSTCTAGTNLIAIGGTISATGYQVGASPGISHTSPLAKLTLAGTNGSITFVGGIATADTDPT